MEGGEISGNKTSGVGGGVYVINGTFTMNSGTISDNQASDEGGGVYIDNGSTATMSGGSITDNQATNGGGVSTNRTGVIFAMSGGSITGNDADMCGKDVNIGSWSSTQIGRLRLSGSAQVGTVALWAWDMVPSRSVIELPSTFTGSVAMLNLGLLANVNNTPVDQVKNFWANQQVIISASGTVDVSKFALGRFYYHNTIQSEAISPAYQLNTEGKLVAN
jgi:hypothetical protein